MNADTTPMCKAAPAPCQARPGAWCGGCERVAMPCPDDPWIAEIRLHRMTCPGSDPDLCTDQTPCPPCPVALDLGAEACPESQASCESRIVRQSTHEQRNAPGTWQAEGVAPPIREVV